MSKQNQLPRVEYVAPKTGIKAIEEALTAKGVSFDRKRYRVTVASSTNKKFAKVIQELGLIPKTILDENEVKREERRQKSVENKATREAKAQEKAETPAPEADAMNIPESETANFDL